MPSKNTRLQRRRFQALSKERQQQLERQHAEESAGYWLYLGNKALERGDGALAARHFAKAQIHHDRMNELLGNGSGE